MAAAIRAIPSATTQSQVLQKTRGLADDYCLKKTKFCEISGCFKLTEYDIAYYGNDVNDGTSNVQSDVASCRSSCKSMGADYFDFNYGGNKECWCKNSNAGRKQQVGVVSGETSCPGEDSFVVYHEQCCMN